MTVHGTGAIMKSDKKYFFGWANIKWFVKEIVNTLSDKPSYFSKKRVQGWMLFLSAYFSSMLWFIYHFRGMDIGTLLAYVGTLFAYAGYQTIQIQREKKNTKKEPDEGNIT